MNARIHSRRFVNIVDIHTLILPVEGTSYYAVGKLAFDLLPILLSKIEGPAVSQVHDILLWHRPFYWIENDPLVWEKVKVMQAIKEFSKVRFLTPLHAFF
jgi:hypothetical protein